MIQQIVQLMIKHLAQEGETKQAIANRTGVCRKTVYNILKEKLPPEKKESLLEPYKAYIKKRLESYNLSAKRLWKEIQAHGFRGSYSTVKPYVREIKGIYRHKLTERYETLPGEQAQMDWGECGLIEENGKNKKLYVFTYVLGYSRMMYCEFTTSMKQEVLLNCLKHAFQELGIPKKLLVDNMKTAVDLHARDGQVKWNKSFLDFAEHYDFLPLAAPPYWPKVKGKVESGVGYVKAGFLEGKEWVNLSDLNSQLKHWLESEAQVRIHGTTRVKPILRYQEESAKLRAYQSMPAYPIEAKSSRKVAWDCHVSYGGVRYSVPPEVAGKTVEISQTESYVTIWYNHEEIACHHLAAKGSPPVTVKAHMLSARQQRKTQTRSGKPRYEQLKEHTVEADLNPYDQLLERVAS
jgi:transposase